jgi:hypothetical protein
VLVLVLYLQSLPVKSGLLHLEPLKETMITITSTIGEKEEAPSTGLEALNLLQDAFDNASNHDLSLPPGCQRSITINP